jgi:hypothetical protein
MVKDINLQIGFLDVQLRVKALGACSAFDEVGVACLAGSWGLALGYIRVCGLGGLGFGFSVFFLRGKVRGREYTDSGIMV